MEDSRTPPERRSHTEELDLAVSAHLRIARNMVESGRLRRAEKKKEDGEAVKSPKEKH